MEPDNQEPINQEEKPTTVEEINQPQPEEEAKPSEEEPKEEAVKKPAKSKGLIALVIIFAILAAVGIGFGIWGIINANQKPEPAPVAPTDPEPTPEPTDNPDEEVEITDTYVIKDLDEKLAALHHTDLLDSPMIARAYRDGGNYDMIYELYNGALSERAKIFATYLYLKDQFEYPTEDAKNTFIAKYPDNYDEIDFQGTKVINANSFASGYRAIFGSDLNLNSITSTTPCPHLRYDEDLGLIITDTRCGGTGPALSYFYKNRYTKDNNHAYAYISAIEVDCDRGIFCGIKSGYEDDVSSLKCGDFPDGELIDEFDVSAYRDKAAEYRFVFTKADDGTYYFEKVEKIS